MDPSRSYTYDQQRRPQLSLYPTHPQRFHHPSSSISAPPHGTHPFQDPSSPSALYAQQPLQSVARGAPPPQCSQYMGEYSNYPAPHLTYTNQQPLGASYSHSGYRSPVAYTDSSQYTATTNQWPVNQDVDRRGFIPTPSEMTSVYPANGHQSPTRPNFYPSPPYSPTNGNAPSVTSGLSPSSPPPPERFPCDKCDKTFSRSHDRKRHYETQHHPVPVIHQCRYCEKEFSRADSLKRHLDNGCDEMP